MGTIMPDWYDLESLGYPYGPPTPDSRAGRIPGEIRNSPSIAEQIGAFAQPIHEYGSMPAKAYVGEVNAAAQNLADFASSPNYADLAAGLSRTAMVAGAPLTGLGLMGGSFAGALGLDALRSTPARAASEEEARAKLKSMSKDEIKALQREMGITADGIAGQGTTGAYLRYLRKQEEDKKNNVAIQTGIAKANAQAEVEKERVRLEAANAAKAAERDAMSGRVDEAKGQLMQDLLAARTPPKDDSYVGQLREKFGPSILPLIAGGVAGGVIRFAPKTGRTLIDDYLNPAMAGAEVGASTELAPLAATANSTETDPSYRAWEQYLMRLPVEAKDELSRANERLSKMSPVPREVTDAREMLNDLGYRGGAMFRGAVSGIAGNTLMKGVLGAPETIATTAARIPGATVKAYREGFKGAPKPRGSSSSSSRTKSPLGDAADKVEGMNGPKTYAKATPEQKDNAFNMLVQEVTSSGSGKVKTATPIPELTKKLRDATGLPITEKRVRETLKMLGEHLGTTGSLRGSSAKRTAQTLGIGGAFAAPAAYSLDEDY